MELLDPTSGRPLPSDAIQRVLFVAGVVHVYNIPPLSSMKGHSATSWTADPARHIFTARLRVIETSTSTSTTSSPSPPRQSPPSSLSSDAARATSGLKVDVVLEDPSSGQLFAAAPYTDPSAVEPVVDSSRFFAVTVRDHQDRRAVLGIGFEERSDAFDLAVALQAARRNLRWDGDRTMPPSEPAGPKAREEVVKDYSLKEGETITVNLGSTKLGRRRPERQDADKSSTLQSFTLPPPPGSKPTAAAGTSSSGGFVLPPPPSANEVKHDTHSLRDLGFDDGQFGEFA
ncbi:hypothetical protein RJ55_04119 [Drechmeria coniospora]|nr:hypothetical protein RJ55_04119 [Drechmeria coniospora]